MNGKSAGPPSTPPKAQRRIRLRTRLVLQSILLVASVLIPLSGFLIWRQSDQMTTASEEKVAGLKKALNAKGTALAANVAVAAERTVLVSDFMMLTEILQSAVENDPEIIYGIIMKRDGQAVAHTDPSKVFEKLTGEADKHAVKNAKPLLQDNRYKGQPVVEAAAPIFVSDEHWGAVRFGLSLEHLTQAVQESHARLINEIVKSVASTTFGAAGLFLLGIILAGFTARSITRPLESVLNAVKRVHEGDFAGAVAVKRQEILEFDNLGRAFEAMSAAVLQRQVAVERALEEAEEASRLKSEFVANVSHELRTPLNAIVNIPSILLDDYQRPLVWHCDACDKNYEPSENTIGADEENDERCTSCGEKLYLTHRVFFNGDIDEHYELNTRALKSARHLLHVVNDLLDFSKLECGRVELFTSTFKVESLIDEVQASLKTFAETNRVNLVAEPGPTDLELTADEVKVSQVLINLVSNAIKFTPAGGTVQISFTPIKLARRDAVRIAVKDNGEGIPEESLQVVFERFRQVDGSHTRKHGGTGLGLAIAKGFVDLHSGEIDVESQLGVGSVFSFTLPLTPPPEKELVREGVAQHNNSCKVFVVDDDATQLELLRHALTSLGHVVKCVGSAENAWEEIREFEPDLVIMDIMMPYVSGLTLLRVVREMPQTAGIPVIVCSAYHSNREIVLKLGGHWMSKPWDRGNLAALTGDLLGCSIDLPVEGGEPLETAAMAK